jgi:hypothetical protein
MDGLAMCWGYRRQGMHTAFGCGNLVSLLVLKDWNEYNIGVCGQEMEDIYSHRQANFVVVISYGREWDRICVILKE